MTTHGSDDAQEKSLQPLQRTSDIDSPTADNLTKTRIRLRIPKEYTNEPVISQLVSNHGVTVNIAAALLGADARDDGWFDLELRGTTHQIQSALTYLNQMNFEIWDESNAQDGW